MPISDAELAKLLGGADVPEPVAPAIEPNEEHPDDVPNTIMKWRTKSFMDWVSNNAGVDLDDNDAFDAVENGMTKLAKLKEVQIAARRGIIKQQIENYNVPNNAFQLMGPALMQGLKFGGEEVAKKLEQYGFIEDPTGTINLLELSFGAGAHIFNAGQQMLFGALAGLPDEEIRSRLLPARSLPNAKAGFPRMTVIDQLDAIKDAALRGDFGEAKALLQIEPQMIEQMQHNITAEDAAIGMIWNGDKDEYGQWLNEQMNSTGGRVKLGLWSGAMTGAELVVDPLMVVNPAVKIAGVTATRIPTVVKALNGISGVGKQARGIAQGGDIVKAVEVLDGLKKDMPVGRTVSNVARLEQKAKELRDTALDDHLAGPTDVTSVRLSNAELVYRDARIASDRVTQGDATAVTFRKPKKFADPPVTRHVVRQQKMDKALDPTMRKAAMAQSTLPEDPIELQKVLDDAAAALKDTDDVVADAILTEYNQLPQNVKDAYAAYGVNANRSISRTSSLYDPIDPTELVDLDNLPVWTQRVVLGPDDAETLGDAARDWVRGTSHSNIHTYADLIPEYQLAGPRAVQGDTRWVGEIVHASMDDAAKRELLSSQSQPGLVPGSWVPNGLKVVGRRATMPVRKAGQALAGAGTAAHATFHTLGRFPQGALRSSGTYDRIRAAYNGYDTEMRATYAFMGKELEKAGKGKLNTFGHIEANTDALRAVEKPLMTPLDTPEWDKAWAALSDSEKGLATQFRTWMNQIADRTSMPRNLPFQDYAAALIPARLFDGGARPIEFLGLPKSMEAWLAHLLPGTGGAGAPADLLPMMDLLNRAAMRRIHVEPMFTEAMDIAKASGKKHHIVYAQQLIDRLSGRTVPWDVQLEESMRAAGQAAGYPVDKWPRLVDSAMLASNIAYSSLLVGSPGFIVNNIGIGVIAPIAKHGPMNTVRGLFKLGTPEGLKMAREAGLEKQAMALFENSTFGQFTDVLARLGNTQSEIFVRSLSFQAALSENLRSAGLTWPRAVASGKSQQLLFEALQASETAQAVYGILGTPPLAAKIAGQAGSTIGMQFLTWPMKQTGFIVGETMKNPGFIFKYMAISGMVQRVAAEQLGIDASRWTGFGFAPMPREGDAFNKSPAFSTLGAFNDYLAALNGGDPKEVELATDKLLRSLADVYVPTHAMQRRLGESMQRLQKDEEGKRFSYNARGEPERPIDFGDEWLGTLLQTPTMRESQWQEAKAQQRANLKNAMQMRIIEAQKFEDLMLRGGSEQEYIDHITRMAELGLEFSDPGDRAQTLIEAQSLTRRLRLHIDDPTFLSPDMVPGEDDVRQIMEGY
jgi:hypothetical protein